MVLLIPKTKRRRNTRSLAYIETRRDIRKAGMSKALWSQKYIEGTEMSREEVIRGPGLQCTPVVS